jgi:hypothetical protein
MIRNKEDAKQFIDISGPSGNAFALIGQARVFAKQLGLDQEAIAADMMSGDYEHLLQVFDENFGMIVDLIR